MRAVLPASDPPRPIPQLGDFPDPVPGPGEVLVDVRAAGLNQADLLQLRGLYPPPAGESEVPGMEASGVVVTGAPAWPAGTRIMALLAGGGQATRVAVPEAQLIPLPENLSFAEGAALPEAALTAWTNLVAEGGLRAGESVLVTGATGGMGSFAAQLARELGAKVIAAGRSAGRLERLRELGIGDFAVEGPELPARVHELTAGRGVDLVFDLTAGDHLGQHLEALAARGRLVLIGLMAGARAELDLRQILRRRLRIAGSVLRPRSREEKGRLTAAFAAFALPRLADGRLRPVVDRTLPLERAAEAYAALGEGGAAGKIILEMP
jgi:putative PIG3 family NAD(P)H quinone oxidoreductase